MVITDAQGDDVGYALYKKIFDEYGRPSVIYLYQCVAAPGQQNAEEIVARALGEVFSPPDAQCRTHNLSKANELVCQLLVEAGFTTFIEQVHMARTFEQSKVATLNTPSADVFLNNSFVRLQYIAQNT